MDYQLLLNNFRKQIDLTTEEEKLILSYVIKRNYKKGEFINFKDEVNRYTNFVKEGSVRTFYIDSNGNEHIIQLAISEWWIGDFPSFVKQQPGFLYTQALSRVELLSISIDHLELIYQSVPKMERFFRLLTQNAYVSFQLRILHNLSFDAEQRYLTFRTTYPEMEKQISQKHIASFLGISAEFLSKIKKRIALKELNK